MKAILTFNLPDDKYEYDMAVKGKYWYNVAFRMHRYLRGKTKYLNYDEHDEYIKSMNDCKDMFLTIMNENGVDFGV